MLAIKIVCPHCHKHLKTSKPLKAGHRILCSRCGHSFVPPAPSNGSPPDAIAPSPAVHPAPLLPSNDLPPDAIAPSPAVRPALGSSAHVETVPDVALAPAGRSNRQALWIGLILGGLFLLLTMTLGLVLFFATRKTPADTSNQAGLSTPTSDESSTAPNPPEGNPPPPQARGNGAGSNDAPLLSDPRLIPVGTPQPEQASWLPPEEQEPVNKAIERGVQWLKKHQNAQGNWGNRVGLAALPALTLLECGVPADDIRIQKALHLVRKAVPSLAQTYDLALVILFLDRLGDPADTKLIKTCALRLAAGQAPSGGWTYGCPILSATQEDDLLMVMRGRQPQNSLDLFVGGSDGSAPLGLIGKDTGAPSPDSKLLPEMDTPPLPGPDGNPLTKELPSPQAVKKSLDRLPAHLRTVPALEVPTKTQKMPAGDGTDNSNTQFAILGLLAAGHHGLPLQRAYARIVQRFHVSQLPDGHWNYHFNKLPGQFGSPAMSGAALLGLAVQYDLAVAHGHARGKSDNGEDPAVEKGFKFLAQSIGKPLGAKARRGDRTAINLYLMWSIERCGVLYKRRQIDGKDWYHWGSQQLVDKQHPDGSWMAGVYPGSMPIADTCFALLFLKRANLAKELTKKLEFFMEGKKLQGSP